MTRQKWYTHDFLAESQNLLERAPTSKVAGLTPPAEGLSTSPRYHLLRRQSWQPGSRRCRRGLRKQDSSYGPRGRSLDKRGQASEPANLPGGPLHPIHRSGYAVSNALRPSALKCASAPSC
ncbi:hypothetical protein TNCV_3225591 [Trichonephila clavipes]|nr:hypothetical protein TNCV_3225591 [Trichonephila clavipes]